MSKTPSGFLFIGESFLSQSTIGRRMDDSYFDVVINKIKFVSEIAKEKKLIPVVLGGLTAKLFDVKSFSALVDILIDGDFIIMPSDFDYIKGTDEINQKSTVGLLSSCRIASVINESGFYKTFDIAHNNAEYHVSVYAAHSWSSSGVICSPSHKGENCFNVVIAQLGADLINHQGGIIEQTNINNCEMVVCGGFKSYQYISEPNSTKWLAVGPLVRTKPEQDGMTPFIVEWRPNQAPIKHIVPHKSFIMDLSGASEDSVQAVFEQSRFAKLLQEEMKSSKERQHENIILAELSNIYDELKANKFTIDVVNGLYSVIQSPTIDDIED